MDGWVLAQGLSRGQVSNGTSHLKDQWGGRRQLPRRLTHRSGKVELAVGRWPQFLTTRMYGRLLKCHHDTAACFLHSE